MFDIFWNIISAVIAIAFGGYVFVGLKSVNFGNKTDDTFHVFLISLVSTVVCYYCWFAALVIFIGMHVIRWILHFFMECIELIHYVYCTPKYIPKYNRHNHIR